MARVERAVKITETETKEYSEMERKLIELIANLLELEQSQITDVLSMKDTDVWDSLKHMELVVTIEQSFGVELTFDEIVAMQNVEKIKSVLRGKGVEV